MNICRFVGGRVMGFIQCPACGTKISDKAVKCPYCGFQSKDAIKPISNQDKYEIVPVFQYSVEGCKTN